LLEQLNRPLELRFAIAQIGSQSDQTDCHDSVFTTAAQKKTAAVESIPSLLPSFFAPHAQLRETPV
jgi:hypothetical protein